jgi:hypothetical protein
VGRISYNRLVQVPDSNLHSALGVGHRAQVSQMAIAANPDGRTKRERPRCGRTQPFVKFKGAPANIGNALSRPSSVAAARSVQPAGAVAGKYRCWFSLDLIIRSGMAKADRCRPPQRAPSNLTRRHALASFDPSGLHSVLLETGLHWPVR